MAKQPVIQVEYHQDEHVLWLAHAIIHRFFSVDSRLSSRDCCPLKEAVQGPKAGQSYSLLALTGTDLQGFNKLFEEYTASTIQIMLRLNDVVQVGPGNPRDKMLHMTVTPGPDSGRNRRYYKPSTSKLVAEAILSKWLEAYPECSADIMGYTPYLAINLENGQGTGLDMDARTRLVSPTLVNLVLQKIRSVGYLFELQGNFHSEIKHGGSAENMAVYHSKLAQIINHPGDYAVQYTKGRDLWWVSLDQSCPKEPGDTRDAESLAADRFRVTFRSRYKEYAENKRPVFGTNTSRMSLTAIHAALPNETAALPVRVDKGELADLARAIDTEEELQAVVDYVRAVRFKWLPLVSDCKREDKSDYIEITCKNIMVKQVLVDPAPFLLLCQEGDILHIAARAALESGMPQETLSSIVSDVVGHIKEEED